MKIPVYLRNGYDRCCIILGVAALLSGGILYFFRPEKILFLRWFPSGFSLNQFLVPFHLPEWVLFSLPDGLWAFAYTLLIGMIWSGNRSWLRYFWLSSAPILVYAVEISQYFKLLPGTFCVLDLVLESSGLIAGLLLVTLKTR